MFTSKSRARKRSHKKGRRTGFLKLKNFLRSNDYVVYRVHRKGFWLVEPHWNPPLRTKRAYKKFREALNDSLKTSKKKEGSVFLEKVSDSPKSCQ